MKNMHMVIMVGRVSLTNDIVASYGLPISKSYKTSERKQYENMHKSSQHLTISLLVIADVLPK